MADEEKRIICETMQGEVFIPPEMCKELEDANYEELWKIGDSIADIIIDTEEYHHTIFKDDITWYLVNHIINADKWSREYPKYTLARYPASGTDFELVFNVLSEWGFREVEKLMDEVDIVKSIEDQILKGIKYLPGIGYR